MDAEEVVRNIERVRARIAQAASRAGRSADQVTLVAVTKRVEAVRMEAAYRYGLRDFAENYMQEAVAKIDQPPLDVPEICWHFIGHLQTNKVKEAVGRFVLIQSVDSLRLASEIGKQAVRAGLTADILLEVKLDPIAAKFGLAPETTLEMAAQVTMVPGIRLRGLMGMAPFASEPEAARPAFRQLYTLFTQLPPECRHTLSMGMTGDFEVAIEEGATMVRLGTALFGQRPQQA
ncbi:MAG TPA: YggS family pyridoxal phosphate-dependent enzyme [Chthonomonadaceae bacterium]|nr:YggS family pyridoxal phosphate-dependent enzyme [Chthonomonadaceae bacterium]